MVVGCLHFHLPYKLNGVTYELPYHDKTEYEVRENDYTWLGLVFPAAKSRAFCRVVSAMASRASLVKNPWW